MEQRFLLLKIYPDNVPDLFAGTFPAFPLKNIIFAEETHQKFRSVVFFQKIMRDE